MKAKVVHAAIETCRAILIRQHSAHVMHRYSLNVFAFPFQPIEINWHDREAVYSVDFSPNSNRVVTAGADGTVRVCNAILLILCKSDALTGTTLRYGVSFNEQPRWLPLTTPSHLAQTFL